MSEQPAALQLRLLQTVVEVAAEKNSTLVLPFPVELLRFLERATPQGDERRDNAATTSLAPNGETRELAVPTVPDDARGVAIDEPLAGRHSGRNS